MSAAPSDLASSVFHVHLTRDINAPTEKAWEILTDLSKYHEWNPFVREMIITGAKKRKEGEQVLAVDKFLVMTCHIPPFTTKAFERITVVDPEHHRLAWANIDYPSWALRAERWQVLSTMGNGQTRYESWEAFNGVLAPLVKWVIGRKLEQAFVAFADGLKGRCEC